VSRCLDVRITVELGPVVRSDGTDRERCLGDQGERSPVEFGDSASTHLADQDIAGGPLDEGDDARLGATEHGVDLPVADFGAGLDGSGPLGDVAFAGESAARVVGSVALASLLGGLA